MAGCAIPTSSAGHAPAGAKTDPKLTFDPDHLVGAGHTAVRSPVRGIHPVLSVTVRNAVTPAVRMQAEATAASRHDDVRILTAEITDCGCGICRCSGGNQTKSTNQAYTY